MKAVWDSFYRNPEEKGPSNKRFLNKEGCKEAEAEMQFSGEGSGRLTWGGRPSWSSPNCGRGSLAPFFSLLLPVRPFGTGQAAHIHEEKKRGVPCLSVEEGNKQVEATDALDSLMPVCACCHAGKSGGFGRFYLLLDLNQWLPPYESNTLTTELSRSFIIPKRTKWNPSCRWIINIILLISNTNQTAMMLDHGIVILTRNSLHDKMWITSTKGYSSVR